MMQYYPIMDFKLVVFHKKDQWTRKWQWSPHTHSSLQQWSTKGICLHMQDTKHLGSNRASSPTTQCSIFMLLESVNISLHEYVSYSLKPLLSIHIIYRLMSLAVYLRLRFSSELLPQFTNSLLYSCLLIPPKPQKELWIGPSLNLLPPSFPIFVTSFRIHTIAQGKPWMCLFPSPCPRSSHYLISNAEANTANSTSTVCLKSTFLHLQLHHWYSIHHLVPGRLS